MQVYLVGGAVRDELLGRPVGERDWVVVGATAEEMTRLGYKRVGRDFPVFLHPETHEEYALARQERKVAPGYRGFVIEFSPGVTLEQDLLRRDLTINAMARAADGRLIDPFGGEQDLKARVLRHVSPAFAEDPVRILRTARFAARLAGQGFEVAPETLTLMRRMSAQGEVDALVPERVWQETERALREASPEVFFGVLRDCGALERIFPELDALYGVPQPPKWHPEIDTGVHTMMVLKAAARLSPDSRMRFAALTHDLGKGQTPRELWPKHHGHEARSVALVNGLCDRLRIPNDFRELALLVAEYHGLMHRAFELRSETLLKLLERTDALRRAERFELFLLACEADARGRTGFEEDGYAQGAFLRRALATIKPVAPAPQEVRELAGPAIAQELRRRRIAALKALERR